MKTFTIATINPSTNELWQIHKAGCRDLSNGRTRNIDFMHEVSAETPELAEEYFFDGELLEMGYKPGDGSARIMPCCKTVSDSEQSIPIAARKMWS